MEARRRGPFGEGLGPLRLRLSFLPGATMGQFGPSVREDAEGVKVPVDVLEQHARRFGGGGSLADQASDPPGHGVVDTSRYGEHVLALVRGPTCGDQGP